MKREEKGERKKKKGREFSREKYYGCGGKGKGLLEKNEGVGKMKKGENCFPHS